MRRSRFHYARMAMLKPPFWLSVNGQTCRVLAGNERGAGTCYSEVVVQDCYGMFGYSKREKPAVIVDIGANIGIFSKLCSMLFPSADIYAYEPNPSALTWLERNAQGTRIQVSPTAVWGSAGVLNFDTSYDSTLGQVSPDGQLSVQCIAPAEIAEGRQIDLLKVDCEGGEFEILKDPSLLGRTKECCLEYHLSNGRNIDELVQLVEYGGHSVQTSASNPGNPECGWMRTTRVDSSH